MERHLLLLLSVAFSLGSTSDLCRHAASSGGFARHPYDCSRFVLCWYPAKPVVMSCGPRMAFDETLQVCTLARRRQCQSDNHIHQAADEFGHINGPPLASMTFAQKMAHIKRNIDSFVQYAKAQTRHYFEELADASHRIKAHRGPFSIVQSFLGNSPRGNDMRFFAVFQENLLRNIKWTYNFTRIDMPFVMKELNKHPPLHNEFIDKSQSHPTPEGCPFTEAATMKCDASAKFRTIDGSCNNLGRPLEGRAFLPLLREIHSEYDDGISVPRMTSVSGEPLISSRDARLLTLVEREIDSSTITLMHMTFGQLLDHDLARTAMTKIKDASTGKLVNVECGQSGCQTRGVENAACLPIFVNPRDPVFGGHKSCLMFVRSQEIPAKDCCLTPREQMNQLTSYLDASLIYGSTLEEAETLRDRMFPSRGKLVITPHENPRFKGLLPQTDFENCREFTPRRKCFLAGEKRANEQVALSALHTVFHRYHNLIEEGLHRLNPHWGGERLYQEARRICGAIWQHIVYNEYLPPTLGLSEMRKFGLTLEKYGFADVYDSSVNAEVGNAFQTAAFRFGHSQITNVFHMADHYYQTRKVLQFSEVFNRPMEMYKTYPGMKSGVDLILLGQISQRGSESNQFFAREVTSNLFSENPPVLPGTDLPTLNIQRGRDHGLPGYPHFRKWCGLSVPRKFEDLYEYIPKTLVRNMTLAYRYVADIDLFVGGRAETPLRGALVGPTFACLIGRQFLRSKIGDRYWYERSHPVTGFSAVQLAEIRKMTLARIMCDTMDHVETIQKFVMLQPLHVALSNMRHFHTYDPYTLSQLYKGENNERRPCSDLPDMDLSPWVDFLGM